MADKETFTEVYSRSVIREVLSHNSQWAEMSKEEQGKRVEETYARMNQPPNKTPQKESHCGFSSVVFKLIESFAVEAMICDGRATANCTEF